MSAYSILVAKQATQTFRSHLMLLSSSPHQEPPIDHSGLLQFLRWRQLPSLGCMGRRGRRVDWAGQGGVGSAPPVKRSLLCSQPHIRWESAHFSRWISNLFYNISRQVFHVYNFLLLSSSWCTLIDEWNWCWNLSLDFQWTQTIISSMLSQILPMTTRQKKLYKDLWYQIGLSQFAYNYGYFVHSHREMM